MKTKVSFVFYSIDGFMQGNPNVTIKLDGSVEVRENDYPESDHVLVMSPTRGPSAEQLKAMVEMTRGRREISYCNEAEKYSGAIRALREAMGITHPPRLAPT